MPGPLAGIDRFPRTRLGHAPTPLDAAPNLGTALGIELWIKRDDCTGLALGGNKVRQLEFYLGEARAQAADTVLITGARNALETMSAADLRVLVDLNELDVGSHSVAPDVSLNLDSDDVENISVLPSVIDVAISAAGPDSSEAAAESADGA